jgi:hypothetical protein
MNLEKLNQDGAEHDQKLPHLDKAMNSRCAFSSGLHSVAFIGEQDVCLAVPSAVANLTFLQLFPTR